ncbi:MAG: adenylate/guanylate cyclase domain-containing protein, partial [Burkholderiales bacterium]
VAETALFFALFAHWLLGLWLIYRRRTLRMPVWEAAQIIFGLAVPPLLVYHLSASRLANVIYGTDDPYTRIILFYWVTDHAAGLRQLALFTLAARVVREQVSRRRSHVRIGYLDGHEVRVPIGWTVLEASRTAGIPHASVCGGRGRCSTCRIRIAGDSTLQPPPSPLERRVLERIGAPPNVRLACQLRPSHDLVVTPLLQAAVGAGSSYAPGGARDGEEREIVVLFADLRGFTRVAERKLPYDVVFILNRYFEAVGGAVAQAGGVANQYTGDGVMALFGIETGPDAACRQAVLAAGLMIERVEALSSVLGGELETPLRMGIGIHVGPVVVGEMGYAGTRYLTAVGDTVNTASRLEGLTKEYKCELVISEDALARAGLAAADYPHHELALRNRDAPLRVVVVDQARRLAERIHAASKARSDDQSKNRASAG